jgi:hypothetical protein
VIVDCAYLPIEVVGKFSCCHAIEVVRKVKQIRDCKRPLRCVSIAWRCLSVVKSRLLDRAEIDDFSKRCLRHQGLDARWYLGRDGTDAGEVTWILMLW